MLDGAKNKAHRPDIRCPITPSILLKLMNGAEFGCTNKYETIMFQCCFHLAFCCFLRVSEFCVPSKRNNQDWNRVIALSDIHITDDGELQLNIRMSKTDQSGKGTLLCLKKSTTSQTCVVSRMERYLEIRPPGDGPLFKHYDHLPLSKYEFSAVLRRLLLHAGIKENIKTHSFRIGAASWCYANNIPDSQIKDMGCWSQSSNSHKLYIRLPRIDMSVITT